MSDDQAARRRKAAEARDKLQTECLQRDDITPAAKVVLVVLLRHWNLDDGRCNPGFARIAERAGVGDRTARRAIKLLAELKIITFSEQTGGAPENTNAYSFPALAYRGQNDPGVILSTDGGHSVRQPGSIWPPNTKEKTTGNGPPNPPAGGSRGSCIDAEGQGAPTPRRHPAADPAHPTDGRLLASTGGGPTSVSGPIPFLAFWSAYPFAVDVGMDHDRARAEWEQLDDEARRQVLAHLPIFCRSQAGVLPHRMLHAWKYLARRRWKGHAEQESLRSRPPIMATGNVGQDRVLAAVADAIGGDVFRSYFGDCVVELGEGLISLVWPQHRSIAHRHVRERHAGDVAAAARRIWPGCRVELEIRRGDAPTSASRGPPEAPRGRRGVDLKDAVHLRTELLETLGGRGRG